MRRPTMRDGVLLPKATGVGVLAVMIGVVTRDYPAGRWLIAAGVVLLVSLILLAWRQVQGAAIAAGLWLVFLGVVLHALPNTPAAAGLRGYWWAVGLAGLGVLGLTLIALRHGRSGTRGTVNRWVAPVTPQPRCRLALAGAAYRIGVRAAAP